MLEVARNIGTTSQRLINEPLVKPQNNEQNNQTDPDNFQATCDYFQLLIKPQSDQPKLENCQALSLTS